MNSSKKISIAVVEDYPVHRKELELLLELEGFEVFGADSGEELKLLLFRVHIDLVVLDLNLPDEDGLIIAARLRKSYPETRIIMLTGRVRGIDKVEGYEAGADIYMTKPQRPRELLAAIGSLTRRMVVEEVKPKVVWLLLPQELSIITPDGEMIPLSHRDIGLLKRFMLAADQHLDLVDLYEHFDLPVSLDGKRQVARIISRLRLKIQQRTSGAPSIKADRQDGYQLCIQIVIS